MYKFFVFVISFGLFLSCKKKPAAVDSVEVTATEWTIDSLPERVAMNSKVLQILKEWPEFNSLELSFDALYRAENREDLILIVEEFVEKQNILAASEYPETFNTPQIKSRQKVLKTFILKTKAALEYRSDLLEPTRELIIAYNALREQLNVRVNNTLDTKLMLQE
ncbi:MAG: hypothetical protein KJN76_00535 [Eudoraea sp.]|nr:hypothetical protein [Eudoraea sp.]